METITPEWLDEVLEAKLSRVLEVLRETRPVPVGDFVKVAQFERRMYPPKLAPPVVIWIDRMEATDIDPADIEPAEEPGETQWDDGETKWLE